jgi:hypothetical protein
MPLKIGGFIEFANQLVLSKDPSDWVTFLRGHFVMAAGDYLDFTKSNI